MNKIGAVAQFVNPNYFKFNSKKYINDTNSKLFYYITITNKPVDKRETTGTIKIKVLKVDSKTEGVLEGAEFTLTDSDNNSTVYVTDNNGNIEITFTKEGIYTLKETKAPLGYILNNQEYKIVVTKELNKIELENSTIWNWLYNLKFDDTTNSLIINGILTITNEKELVNINVKKVWDDNNNNDNQRKETVIRLYANGIPTSLTKVITIEEDEIEFSFDNLEKYNNGALVIYTVKEDPVEGYETQTIKDGNNFVVTNHHDIEKTSINVKKIWDDEDNKDKLRKETKIYLLANNSKTGLSKVVTIEGNEIEFSFDNLDKYRNGELIEYSIVEDEIFGYEISIEKEGNNYVITNYHKVEEPTPVPPTQDKVYLWIMALVISMINISLIPYVKKSLEKEG